jgi:CDP-diacylglycerol--serine O-phosphatidyltransferase
LARFNVQKDEHTPTTHFQGLPTPMAAGTIASFSIAMPFLLENVSIAEPTKQLSQHLMTASHLIVPPITALLGWLMVSRVRYPHLASELARRRNFSQLVEIVFAMVVVITLQEFALPVLFGYFVLAPPINQLRLRATARNRVADGAPSDVSSSAETPRPERA